MNEFILEKLRKLFLQTFIIFLLWSSVSYSYLLILVSVTLFFLFSNHYNIYFVYLIY